ncbi:decarboxylating 6-phosphogluconate dehydrogenase-like protein [Euroglyphus maynei]|uniref:6-phosphogluconate dehydrogenase, decarboxylating n=1 Tax=Euroglyphus maynei TaxID=6958 RepID=A0A1Y3APU2_EURMA|nr:decarboxylating 6-phosphogluconate dehydrogenase-like protein [Euroglyphus maynei]
MSSEGTADIALIGLAVMGQNLILNMADHGFKVCAYNRTTSKVDDFLANEAKGNPCIIGAHSLEEMVTKLKKPRKIILLVKAGLAVDSFIEQLIPLLEPNDIIIDGGNSEYTDTQRRCDYLKSKHLLFIGSGVSGGEEGARYGPSLMPGGHPEAWPYIRKIFQSISAKADNEPCCDWVGNDGAGHFVKMVHNGIEYGDMQIICEAYHLMKNVLGLSNDEMGDIFDDWNKGELNSFLIEITRDIMRYKDTDGQPLALYASKIVSYAQGFMLLREAAAKFNWNLNYGGIALMWRGGCIIRSVFLGNIKKAFDNNPELQNLMMDDFFRNEINKCQDSWRNVIATAVKFGIPTPAFSTAIAFYDGYRSAHLPANLIQAQRDYFGAHTYQLINNPGTFIHTNWTGKGGNVSSSTYNA